MMEIFRSTPKPRQIVWGDQKAQEWLRRADDFQSVHCLDVCGCRSNVLMERSRPLPIGCPLDDVEAVFDDNGKYRRPLTDFEWLWVDVYEQHEVVFSIPTNSQGRLVLSPDEQRVYLTQENLNVLLVIDPAAREVTDTIRVGEVPVDIGITPDGKKLYVVNAFSRDISVVDTDTRQVTGTIEIGAIPAEIAVTGDGLRAYVTNLDRGVISVVDLVRDRVVGAIQVPGEASRGMAFSPDGETLYVGSQGLLLSVSVSRNLISRSLKVGDGTAALGILPDGSRAYVGTVDIQRGGAGMTVVDVDNWQVMGRMLGVSFAAQVGFRRLGTDQVVAQ